LGFDFREIQVVVFGVENALAVGEEDEAFCAAVAAFRVDVAFLVRASPDDGEAPFVVAEPVAADRLARNGGDKTPRNNCKTSLSALRRGIV